MSSLPYCPKYARVGIILTFLLIVSLFSTGYSTVSADFGQWYVALNGNDRNSCQSNLKPCRTVAAAIKKAGNGDIIYISNGWYYENLVITKEITLLGESMEQTILDGSREGSVIDFEFSSNDSSHNLSVENLTITGGLAEKGGAVKVIGGQTVRLHNVKIIGNEATDRGGGIYSNDTRIFFLDSVQLLNNISQNEGGGVYFIGGPIQYVYYSMAVTGSTFQGNEAASGGGIYANGTLNVTNSLIEKNTARIDGGGIYTIHEAEITLSKINNNQATLTGGGICNENSDLVGNRLSIADTTLDGNKALLGGGIYNRGILSLEGSTLSNNIASSNGGGIWNGGIGSGINNLLYSINSTISGNQAKRGGGIWGGEILANGFYSGHLKLINLTIAYNSGKGIYSHAGDVSLRNVLLAANTGGNCDFSVELEEKNSLSDDGTCDASIQADPLIGPLADNGGNTMTHQLLPGSPAIDRAVDTTGLHFDQRNFPRPRDGSWDSVSDMDIGSYEADYPIEPH
jgi:predicted outer membrane repeat protein